MCVTDAKASSLNNVKVPNIFIDIITDNEYMHMYTQIDNGKNTKQKSLATQNTRPVWSGKDCLSILGLTESAK